MAQTVVVGAGVVGLTTAILAQEEANQSVVILAEHFSGDPKSIHYTSSWAGAHHVSVATPNEPDLHKYDRETLVKMLQMIKDDPDVPLMLRNQTELREHTRSDESDQFSLLETFQPEFRYLSKDELPEGVTHGATFKAIMIDSPNYLKYLLARFQKNGGTLHRCTLPSLSTLLTSDLVTSSSPYSPTPYVPFDANISAIINCTALGSASLTDVADSALYPTRGQTVLVRAPWLAAVGGITRTGLPGQGIYTYIIPRKSGDVIIGGTADVGDFEPKPRAETTEMIKRRGIQLCPELLPVEKRAAMRTEDLDVIEEGCGLRPTREGGIRVELGSISVGPKKVPLVHNYGHGGYGYQSSWGSAAAAVDLLKGALSI